jgi:hypothetical protein
MGIPLVIGLERDNGKFSRFETNAFPRRPSGCGRKPVFRRAAVEIPALAARWIQSLYRRAAQRGEHLQRCYSPEGERRFDYHFMGEQVYEKTFQVIACDPEEVPPTYESGLALGRHLDGCRIGFDLGASDRKVSAVMDGQVVYSEEVIWEPRKQADPEYHYREIMAALESAAAHLPRWTPSEAARPGSTSITGPWWLPCFGPSLKIASMRSRTFSSASGKRWGAPGSDQRWRRDCPGGIDVLEDTGILGIAMGSSEAAGYVDLNGHILGWLNELAFAPVDYSPLLLSTNGPEIPAVVRPTSRSNACFAWLQRPASRFLRD